MKRIDLNHLSKIEFINYVIACEDSYKSQILDAVKTILNDDNIKIVTLCGPTCSGKTTSASKISEFIDSFGKCARVISIDNFYKENINNKKVNGIVDYETVNAIDLESLEKCTEQLLNGSPTNLPIFDFRTHKKNIYNMYVPKEKDIYIFEGIQALYPEIQSLFCNHKIKNIFINVDEDIIIDGHPFSKEDIRLIRRIVRDFKFRNASVDLTMSLWPSVRDNEKSNIFPYVKNVDFIINSFMDYELLIMNSYFDPIINNNCKYTKLNELRNELFEIKYKEYENSQIPSDSVIREFIGQ